MRIPIKQRVLLESKARFSCGSCDFFGKSVQNRVRDVCLKVVSEAAEQIVWGPSFFDNLVKVNDSLL